MAFVCARDGSYRLKAHPLLIRIGCYAVSLHRFPLFSRVLKEDSIEEKGAERGGGGEIAGEGKRAEEKMGRSSATAT